MKGRRADVSLNFIFYLILMSIFPITIGRIQKNQLSHLKKVIFPYLTQVKGSLKYLKEQISLTIMNTFKGQDNDVILDLCQKHLCQAVIDPHNLTNRFHPLDITNKPSKYFISNKYNQWLSMQISQ